LNFCPQCGYEKLDRLVPAGDHLVREVCSRCEIIHYENPKLVVGCLPIWEGKVLLAKRAIEPRRDLWNLPCGFMELDETVKAGASREVFEETGANVKVGPLHCVYDLPHAKQVYMIFLATMVSGHYLRQTAESMEVKLFHRSEIPWPEIAFSSSSFALQKYYEDLDAGRQEVHFGIFDKTR
jgi:ADP-ribose pyrophosphatase YjhB (NUDIX family)